MPSSTNPNETLASSTSDALDLIGKSFSAKTVPPVALPITYRLGLLLLCGLMIILPLIYLSLITLACYGLYYHASYNVVVFENTGTKAAIIAYFSPLIIGGILIFFMIKPLFAPKAKHVSPIKLKPGQEPILEDFVNRICEAVKAPKPRSIAIDGEVNASASFEGGILAFLTGRLRLTIGLPLLAGMPVHSVGGVLAHEFGHFAQGGGMRLTYIIRMINHWFARVVYGRDSWDESIERNSENSDFRIMILLLIARCFIFVVRKILWALMQIGNIASCYMARQMEYDADSYETRFAGSAVFAQTSERLTKLGYASQSALSQLQSHYETKKLSDDLPSFIEHCRSSFTPEQIESIDKAQAEHKTKILDTHPCDADRIAYANKLNSEGIFHLDQPATLLLRNYTASAQEVTRHHYSEVFGLDTSEVKLLNNDEILAAEAQLNTQLDAASTFLHGTCTIELPLALRPLESPSDEPNAAMLEDRSIIQQLQSALAKLKVHAFNAQEFQIAVDDAYKRNTARYFDQYPDKYSDISKDASEAFSLAASVHAQQLHGEERARFIARYELFRTTCSLATDWFNVRDAFIMLQTKFERWNITQPDESEISSATSSYAKPIESCFRSLASKIDKSVPLPFADEDAKLGALDFVYDSGIRTDHTLTDAFHRAAHYLEKFHIFYHRLLGLIAVELKPLTEPESNPEEPETKEPQLA